MSLAADLVLDLPDLGATRALAAALADIARPGDVFALQGDLGSGKTSFARAFIAAAAGAEVEVPSPTFNLALSYDTAKGAIWHFDLYRVIKADELVELGLVEALAEAICLIEWPERMGAALPSTALTVELLPGAAGPESRRARLSAGLAWSRRLIGKIPNV